MKAQVLAGESPAGRFVPARSFERDREPAQLERLGAPLRGGLRPLRQRQDGAEVLAQPLQPGPHHRHRLQLQPAAAARRPRCRGATSTATTSPRASAAAPATPGRRLRDRLRPAVLELRHRRAQRVTATTRGPGTSRRRSRCSTSCCPACRWRQLVPGQLPQPDRRPSTRAGRRRTTRRTRSTTRSPASRSTVYARSAAAQARPTRNLDTYDPEREAPVRGVQSRVPLAHPGRRPDVRRAVAIERERVRRSARRRTIPNYVSMSTATRHLQRPAAVRRLRRSTSRSEPGSSCRARASRLGPRLQRRRSRPTYEPDQHRRDDRRRAASRATRPTARRRARPARSSCRPASSASRASPSTSSRERATSWSGSRSSTSRWRARSASAGSAFMPMFEVFNVNNSDAIISYVTTNALSATYLAPNSIMQGRMYGLGVMVRW